MKTYNALLVFKVEGHKAIIMGAFIKILNLKIVFLDPAFPRPHERKVAMATL